jgi:hypothetical protein
MNCTLREWQQLPKKLDEVIIGASTTDANDGLQPFPIGMNVQFLGYRDEFKKNSPGTHEKTVLYCVTPDTDQRRRPRGQNRRSIEFTLHERGIYNLPFYRGVAFYNALKDHKFCISPEGNGIDCHRHYEALMLGCIPVVEDHPLMRQLYEGCPILWTKSYRDINETVLQRKYKEMLDQQWDFSRLFLSFYSQEQQRDAKRCSNHWIKKLAGLQTKYYADAE